MAANSLGSYWVEVTSADGCTAGDTTFVQVEAIISAPILGLDTVEICEGFSHTFSLDPNLYPVQTWMDTLTGVNSFTANSPGTYWVEALDTIGCIIQDSGQLVVTEIPPFDLGDDQEICPGESITLQVPDPTPYDSLVWQDGSLGPTFTATDSGGYRVIAWFKGCNTADSVRVDTCPSTILLPNVFTPNGDGINDFFDFDEENLEVYEVHIFDRWGKEVYFTEKEGAHWDGNFNGRAVPVGVYYWTIRYKLLTRTPAELVEESGVVTVIR